MRLKNKIALITGGSSGIGKESCLLFAEEGATVVVVDINEPAGKETERLILEAGGDAAFFKADISNSSDCEAMINYTVERFGGLHILFNNAGIMHSEDGDSQSTEEHVWDLTMNINVKGVSLAANLVFQLFEIRAEVLSSIPPLLSHI